MLRAVTRKPGPALAACELEFLTRRAIDIEKAIEQHRSYEACLTELGAVVTSLAADDAMADGVFVEDPAVVLDEAAVITRMAAKSRQPEQDSIARALAPYRELHWLSEPATLEGGDVLRVGKTVYIGASKRTNIDGIRQLSRILQRFGYVVKPVEVQGCLHLKTACCDLGDGTFLANRAWFDASAVQGRLLDVPPDEPWGANVLRIGNTVVASVSAPRTCEVIAAQGHTVRVLDISELQKAEAGLTCMSLLLENPLAVDAGLP